MLSDQFEFPGRIKGTLLDKYLEKGWYRTGCVIFTTHYLAPFNDDAKFRVYWLRYLVNKVQPSSTAKKLMLLNKNFTVSYKRFALTAELDALHKRYAASVKFAACQDLETILVDIYNDVYDSFMIEVRDDGKLIAVGVLDLGNNAIEGIINIYDPDYKKHSLGKYLILMKYRFCVAHNIPYYYPGYYMPEHPLFHYKLFLDTASTEVYVPETDLWMGYDEFVMKVPV